MENVRREKSLDEIRADEARVREELVHWTEESGTGEQAQEGALHKNLSTIQEKLEVVLNQTDSIKDEEAKKIIELTRKFLSEVGGFLDKKPSYMRS